MAELADPAFTDIPGLSLGHWTHGSGTTGCTVVVFPQGARGGVAVPGHAPGSRELGALSPTHLAEDVHAFVLSGGSAFGLATADGVMGVLAEAGIGFPTSAGPVPIVPAAILFDLPVAAMRPGAAEGAAAARQALGPETAAGEGPLGAGAGARVGKAVGTPVPGGLGSACLEVGSHKVGALAAVNAFGCVRRADTGAWVPAPPGLGGLDLPLGAEVRGNTTLVIVATDAPLSRPQCTLVAEMAVAGMARAINPVFTPFDGDTVFVGATGKGTALDPLSLLAVGQAAADAVEQAIGRAVLSS